MIKRKHINFKECMCAYGNAELLFYYEVKNKCKNVNVDVFVAQTTKYVLK